MADKLLIYDLEICNAIPPKNDADRLPDIKYCGGWADFQEMGISAVSWCVLMADTLEIRSAHVSEFNSGVQQVFLAAIADESVKIGGFNSRKFDDELLQANEIEMVSDFDILDLILEAADVHGTDYWRRGLRYNLASIAQANGLEKGGLGSDAPVLFQQGKKTVLLSYCLNDALITTEIFRRLLKGMLVDPNTYMTLVAVGRDSLLM